ncbi:hypothetical protein P5629_01605 [Bacillus subtilis]
MKKMAILLSIVLVLALAACGGPKHSTAMEAAKSFMTAVTDGDSDAIEELNHSNPMLYPTEQMINLANKNKMVGMDIDDFTFKQSEDDENTVTVTWNNGDSDWDLYFVKEDDGYYFSKLR